MPLIPTFSSGLVIQCFTRRVRVSPVDRVATFVDFLVLVLVLLSLLLVLLLLLLLLLALTLTLIGTSCSPCTTVEAPDNWVCSFTQITHACFFLSSCKCTTAVPQIISPVCTHRQRSLHSPMFTFSFFHLHVCVSYSLECGRQLEWQWNEYTSRVTHMQFCWWPVSERERQNKVKGPLNQSSPQAFVSSGPFNLVVSAVATVNIFNLFTPLATRTELRVDFAVIEKRSHRGKGKQSSGRHEVQSEKALLYNLCRQLFTFSHREKVKRRK